MLPVLQPAQLGRELAACTILGAAVGVVRAFFPVRGRGAFVPDALLTGAVLFGVQSYAAALSSAGVLRWYMVLAAFAAALCTAAVLGIPVRWAGRCLAWVLGAPVRLARQWVLRPLAVRRAAQHAKNAGTQKEPQKIRKRTCQTSAVCCIIQTYQSKRRDAVCLLRRWGRVQWQIRAAKRAGSVRLAKR